jgi:hypothetical protein
MWREPSRSCSKNTVASPQATRASERAAANASARSASERTRRMPRPPPPAVAFTMSGKPSSRATVRACSSASTGPPLQGATGTPQASAMRFEPILSPSARITSGSGPRKTTPSLRHSSANSACSETNPQPTQAASARVARSARSSAA